MGDGALELQRKTWCCAAETGIDTTLAQLVVPSGSISRRKNTFTGAVFGEKMLELPVLSPYFREDLEIHWEPVRDWRNELWL